MHIGAAAQLQGKLLIGPLSLLGDPMQHLADRSTTHLQSNQHLQQFLDGLLGKTTDGAQVGDEADQTKPKVGVPHRLLGQIHLRHTVFATHPAVTGDHHRIDHFHGDGRDLHDLTTGVLPSSAETTPTIGAGVTGMFDRPGRLASRPGEVMLAFLALLRLAFGLFLGG